jgi:hypothetical protein
VKAQKVTLLSSHLNKFQNVRDFCINHQTNEAFFTIQSPNQDISQIACVKNGAWEDAGLLSFCDGYSYLEPFLTPNGNRLYFASNRPRDINTEKPVDFDIWYVERSNANAEWTAPINAGEAINSTEDEFYPVVTEKGNLYFTKDSKNGLGKDDIYICKWNGSSYENATLLQGSVNSTGYEFNAFVSQDESFMILTRYNALGGYGSGDLYISRKDQNGLWSIPENMGSTLNTPFMEYCPFYDPQTQTLYFTSKRNTLLPQKFSDLNAYNDYIKRGENGLSKIYQFNIKL